MKRASSIFALLVLLAPLVPATAAADVARYAVLIGRNDGRMDDEMLRFAEEDARRVDEVLGDLGGFSPENRTLLRAPSADEVRATLIRINDRIRTAGAPALLVVFYSGHADATELHLGDSSLSFEQLEQLVRGSSASFRLLIVDACRSGGLTRVKGGSPIPAAPVALRERLPADGVVFWSSSSANEDAQESDELGGSFFTHYLVSGLLGSADEDGDGVITVGEAYQHAYRAALRASSRTLAGAQHATFRQETHGMTDIALTRLAAKDRALVGFPGGRDYLVFHDGPDGNVVAEVGARDVERRVSLRPGRYFVRGRASDHLLEGSVVVRRGDVLNLDEASLDRVAYARLVRKGGGLARADRVELGYTVRSSLWSDADVCQGLSGGWAMDFASLSIGARVHVCRGGFANPYVDATTDELGGELRASHAWDLSLFTVSAGVLAGVSVLSQRFESPGNAPSRTSAAGRVGLSVAGSVDVAEDLYVALELDGLTSFFAQETDAASAARAVFSLRGNVLLGKRF